MSVKTPLEGTYISAYDGGYDEDSDWYHQSIKVPPPSRIFIVGLVHRSQSVFKVLADRSHASTSFRALELLVDHGFRR